MPDERTDRTNYLGLLALMMTAADAENWSYPYWNVLMLDAALSGLAWAERDGVAHLTAPTVMPTAALVTSGGLLAAGRDLDIVQTFVDDYGRETLGGPIAGLNTGVPIVDPAVAATYGTITPGGTGYAGGLFEAWFSWTDGNGGETLPSPVVSMDVPYLTGGLLSDIQVVLPSLPSAVGAAGANVYARHRSGNVVLAYRIEVASVDTITLTGVAADCYRTLPLANSTLSSRSINVTGRAANAGETPALTRFYVRPDGTAWSSGDRRLKLAGVDEWDPDTVTYPLLYTGATGELVAGYPPSISQVKAIRQTDLATETVGILPNAQIPAEIARDAEIAALLGGPYVVSGLVAAAQGAPDMTVQVSTGWAVSNTRLWNPSAAPVVTIATAHGTLGRIDLVCIDASGTIVSSGTDAACKGTAAGSPAAPADPTGYVVLAQVTVPALDTTIESGQIVDYRPLHPTLVQLDIETDAHAADDIHASASLVEVDTGTDNIKKVTPDGLAGSYAGTKSMSIIAVEQTADVITGGSKVAFVIPPALDGMDLVYANAWSNTAGVTLAPPGPLTSALGTGVGNVDNGLHKYKVTLTNATGETEAGTANAGTTVVDKAVNGKIELTAIPIGAAGTTSRKIYRTVAGGAVYKLLATIADNVTTIYTDNIADVSLGVDAPSNNTTGVTTVEVYNVTQSIDMLTTGSTIATGVNIGTPADIDELNDDVAGGDVLRIDVSSETTTPAKGLMVVLEFRLP